jgi:hypothetical protein
LELTESQFLKSTSGSFWVKEVDEHEFESDPTTVDGKELPIDGSQGDRIDVLGEESSDFAKDLFDSDTTGSLSVREEFDEVG